MERDETFLKGKRSEDVQIAASCNLLKRRPSGDKASFKRRRKSGVNKDAGNNENESTDNTIA